MTKAVRAYSTPVFSPSDPLVCHQIQLRPSLWAVVFDTLATLANGYHWDQTDPASATVEEVCLELTNAMDSAIFTGCKMIGDILTIARDPADWELVCDGTVYNRVDYPELYAAILPVFRLDADTFMVPDIADRFIFYGAGVGDTGGESSHEITIAELPPHTHGEQDPGSVVVQAGTGAVALADPGLPSQTGSTGGGDAMPIMPPYITLSAVIIARYPNAE